MTVRPPCVVFAVVVDVTHRMVLAHLPTPSRPASCARVSGSSTQPDCRPGSDCACLRRRKPSVSMAKKPSASQLLAAHAIRHGVEDVVSALGRTEVPATLGAKPILSADSSPAAVRAVLETLGWRALVPVAKAATRSDTRIELLSSRFSSVHAAVLENPQVTAEEVEFYLTRHTGRSLGKTAAERAAELVFRHRLDHLVPRLPKRAVLEAVPYPSYSTTGQLFKGTDTTPLGSVMPGLNRLLLEAFESADPARWAGGWFTAEHTKLAAAHIHHVDGLSPDWAKKAM